MWSDGGMVIRERSVEGTSVGSCSLFRRPSCSRGEKGCLVLFMSYVFSISSSMRSNLYERLSSASIP